MQIYLQTIKIQFFSEYLLTSVFNYLLVKFGRELHWNNMLIISFDSKMEAQENGVITNFRCDTVFIISSKLYIIEFKFRTARSTSQGLEAYKCLLKKEYGIKVLKFLRKHYTELANQIKYLNLIEIGYSIKNESINVGIASEEKILE